MKNSAIIPLSRRAILGTLLGASVGAFIFWLIQLQQIGFLIAVGAGAGALVASMWPILYSMWLRVHWDDWHLTEAELQGLKFTSAGSQRRAAWKLFVEVSTRIAAQPLSDAEGDDGKAISSLHELFRCTRDVVAQMEPTRIGKAETVETYALAMLNGDLRPFLSKWHPLWEAWRDANQSVPCTNWQMHGEFRSDLRHLQPKIHGRAKGFAQIAGIPNIARFFPDDERQR